jgi:hypothetical protein
MPAVAVTLFLVLGCSGCGETLIDPVDSGRSGLGRSDGRLGA